MSQTYTYKMFEVFGIEIEYMIIDTASMLPTPLAHILLSDEDGVVQNSLSYGDIAISNELAAHVIELKADPPTADLKQLALNFQRVVNNLNTTLMAHGARLAPSGMHPVMDPQLHGALWQYGDKEIYQWYDQTFGCQTHGWFNLQSCHLNLPFQTEKEFATLHDAIILILPLLPALSASSPYIQGKHDGYLDTRILVYANNQKRFPQIVGSIIPESIRDQKTYKTEILDPAYLAVKPYDTDGIVEPDWLNSRGAIARFDRGAIEIRLLDTQENPSIDIALCAFIIEALKSLVKLGQNKLQALVEQFAPSERKSHLLDTSKNGGIAQLAQRELIEALELDESIETVSDFWKALLSKISKSTKFYGESSISQILEEGSLAERMLAVAGQTPTNDALNAQLKELSANLEAGTFYKQQ